MNLAEALRYLDRHINLEARAGRVEGLSLERMRALAHALGDPQHAFPVVHVTGTNGKGSTVLMITELLVARGLSVGTYMSPHVERINERLRWNGEPIDDDHLAAVISDVAPLAELVAARRREAGEAAPEPSYFELMTAAALQWFADISVDVAVVEVGLLGRFDATNIVDAQVAVITNVARDHTDGEGDWRRRVAWEKAGIITERSALVLGETRPELRDVFLDERPASVVTRGIDFACEANHLAVGGRVIDVRTSRRRYDNVFVRLHGEHQGHNAALAIAAVEELFDQPLEDDVVAEALAKVEVPGRFEIMDRNPLVIIDAAHNTHGAAAVTRTLYDDFGEGRTRFLVLGMLEGRDVGAMLDAFDAASAEVVLCVSARSPRAVPAERIAEVGRARGVSVEVAENVAEAIERARALAGEGDVILVAGSFYVVGDARRLLRDG
jgi:dihydrofolate synthase/folylpolyglutamate synthase